MVNLWGKNYKTKYLQKKGYILNIYRFFGIKTMCINGRDAWKAAYNTFSIFMKWQLKLQPLMEFCLQTMIPFVQVDKWLLMQTRGFQIEKTDKYRVLHCLHTSNIEISLVRWAARSCTIKGDRTFFQQCKKVLNVVGQISQTCTNLLLISIFICGQPVQNQNQLYWPTTKTRTGNYSPAAVSPTTVK